MDLELLRRALDIEVRADRAQIATLESIPPDAPPEAVAELQALAFHLLAGTETWITRVEGGTPQLDREWRGRDPEEFARGLDVVAAAAARLAAGLTAARLDEEIAYLDSRGRSFTTRLDDAALHILMHGSEHRGQIQAEVGRLGGTPLETGYIGYLRGDWSA